MLGIKLNLARHTFIVQNAYSNIYQVHLTMVFDILMTQLVLLLATVMQTRQGVQMIGRAHLEDASS